MTQPRTLVPPSQRQCGKVGQCVYLNIYANKSFTIEVVGTETLSFDSTGGAQTVSFPNSIFGCGANNNLTFRSSDKATGLVGLVAGQLSLVSQLGAQIGYKFSYLKFGSEAIITTNGVVSTPLIIKPSLPSFTSSTLKSSPSAKRWCQRVESMTT